MLKPAKQSWLDRLREATQLKWSGDVELFYRNERLGHIMLYEGLVAWAVCKYQPEDLGSFLSRIGKVDREQLTFIRAQYAEYGGKKKLGTLLEEAGCISRSVLRRCLLLHVRMAIRCLMRQSGLLLRELEHAVIADREFAFSIEEVTNSSVPSNPALLAPWQESEPISLLADLRGYRASVILSREGEVIAAHTKVDELATVSSAAAAASLIESASRFSEMLDLGGLSLLIMDCSQGTMLSAWLDNNAELLAMVLLDEGANLGMAKYKLNATLERIVAGLTAAADTGT